MLAAFDEADDFHLLAADSGIADSGGGRLARDVKSTSRDIRQPGDANMNRVVDQRDVIQVLQASDVYLSGRPARWGRFKVRVAGRASETSRLSQWSPISVRKS